MVFLQSFLPILSQAVSLETTGGVELLDVVFYMPFFTAKKMKYIYTRFAGQFTIVSMQNS